MPAAVLAAEDGPFLLPHAYELGPGESFIPYAIAATWDGSGAAGPFLACCSFYSQDGRLLARTFPAQVAAGDTAEVTYSPFGQPASAPAGGAGGGIDFTPADTQQAGAWLDLRTHEMFQVENDGPYGIYLDNVAGNGGVNIYNSAGDGGINLDNSAGGGGINLAADAVHDSINLAVRGGGGGSINFGTTPGDTAASINFATDGVVNIGGRIETHRIDVQTVGPSSDQATVGAAGAAAALPAAPVAYIILWLPIAGADPAPFAIPVYNP